MAGVVHCGAVYLTLTIWDAPFLGARPRRRIIRSVIGRCVARAWRLMTNHRKTLLYKGQRTRYTFPRLTH
jgi:hypothetical protein